MLTLTVHFPAITPRTIWAFILLGLKRDALGRFLRDEALRLGRPLHSSPKPKRSSVTTTSRRARQLDPPARGRGTARLGPPATLCPAAGLPTILDAHGP